MRRLLIVFLAFCFVFPAWAQEQKKPKIGLVLSGGGAKGLAHIGVLKVLDEAGIKVSYIGGTSMGAIIGGLYASGYNARQLDSIFSEVDSDALLQDYIPRTSKNFFEKRNDEVYALTLPFKNYKIGVPTALSKGLYNYNLLSRLTAHVRYIKDFNELPIPFVCIATDIEKGEEVVLRSGVLPKAILASGAFPSLYSPIEIDGRILIDGGVKNNYPVEEVRKMGADIIIGVDVQDGLKEKDELSGATSVLVQITNFDMIHKMEEKKNLTDIYIKPDIKGFSVISFNESKEIIKKGEEAAFAVYEKLKKIGNVNDTLSAFKIYLPQDTLRIRNIDVNPLKNYTKAYVLGKLRFRQNSVVSFKKLSEGMGNLNSTQNFSSISYSFDKDIDGDCLTLELDENPINRYLRFGLHFDGLYKSAVLLNFTQKKLFFKNDVISADLILGDNIRYNLNYYFDNGFSWSFGFNSRYYTFNKNIRATFSNDYNPHDIERETNIDFSDFNNQLFAQTIFAQRFLIGAGTELKYLKIESGTLQDGVEPVIENSAYFSIYGYMKFDSLDKIFFPKKGFKMYGDFKSFLLSTDYLGNFEPFSIAKADLEFNQTFFKRVTVKIQSEGGFSIGKRTTAAHDFVLGGYGYTMINNFRHFYGYDFLSLEGDSYVKGEAALDWEFYRKNHFNFSANYANIGRSIFESDAWISKPTFSGYAIGYGLETFIGPVEIKHSWSPETHNHFTWFSVGFWF